MKNLRTGRTRCLLVRPAFIEEQTFYNLTDVYQLLGAKAAAPPLGLLIVAALLPKHWELRLVDHDVTPLTHADLEWADLVFVGGIGPQQDTMLDVVRRAHALGKPVVVGGSGPTLQAQIYAEADYVVSGEVEAVIGELLEDLERGQARGVYRSTSPADLSNPVIPRYDLCRLHEYMFIGLGFTRGCPFACEFCAQIEIFGRSPRAKTPAQIVAELQTLYDLGYRGMIDFGYDNLIGTPSQTREVLQAMRDWAIRHDHPFCYSTEATINLAKHADILRLMKDNDFRYLFVGIESADDAVLEQTKKSQNNSIRPQEAIRIFNDHGLIVYTGIILGFDTETDRSAQNILDMVQETGAFPALVLPLHALPGTQLSTRLSREGRLFGEGDIRMNTNKRTDTATTGLNFVTARPRTEIMRDLMRVLEELYQPKNHYARVALTAAQLRPAQKQKPGLRQFAKMVAAFGRIATTIGLDRESGPLFWRALASVLAKNPAAAEMVIGLAVMNVNYARQARSYIEALREQIAMVERMGETVFNARMVSRPAQGVVPLGIGAAE